jgi:hypothetical protein
MMIGPAGLRFLRPYILVSPKPPLGEKSLDL